MSFLRHVGRAVVLVSAAAHVPVLGEEQPGQAEAKAAAAEASSVPALTDYGAQQTYEVHTAVLLKELLMDNLAFTRDEEAAITRHFAEFIRATMENKPRSVLIAYSARSAVTYDGNELKPAGDTAEELHGEMKDGKLQRPLLVEQIRNHVDSSQLGRFEVLISRWNTLRPPPIDGPLARLGRAMHDPDLGVRGEALESLQSAMRAAFENIPKFERRPGMTDKYEPEVRQKILAHLQPQQIEHFQKTVAWLGADYAKWQQPGHVETVYAEAVHLLGGSEAKPASEEKAASAADSAPKDSK